jgi:hypothetical protein
VVLFARLSFLPSATVSIDHFYRDYFYRNHDHLET